MTEMTKIQAAPDAAALLSKLIDEVQRTNIYLKKMNARLEQVEAATVVTAYAHSKSGHSVMSQTALARRLKALETITNAESA